MRNFETERINGTEWVRTGGMNLPMHLPGSSPGDALPKTQVKLTLEIEGGGLPEGQSVTVAFDPLTLTNPEQLTIDVLEEQPEVIDHEESWDYLRLRQAPRQMVRLNLKPVPIHPDAERIFTVIMPEGTIEQ